MALRRGTWRRSRAGRAALALVALAAAVFGLAVTGESVVIDVVDGRYTVVDIGLVPAQS